MDTFKCESCGSTNIIEKNNQTLCAYCQSNQIKKESKETLKSTALYGIALIATVAIIGIYLLSTNNKIVTDKQNAPISTTKIAHANNIKNINPSTIKKEKISQTKFTPWLSKEVYQARFDSGYFRDNSIYPAYVELDNHGNRRVIEIAYEPRFYWTVTSGRLLKEFQKLHVKHTMNGKELLSMSIKTKQGVSLYTGTWISSSQIQRESNKLKALGIYPTNTKFQADTNFVSSATNTKMIVSLITANTKDADTKGRIFISLNADKKQSYLLDKPKYKDHTLGSTDYYTINIEKDIEDIKKIKLSIEGKDAWKMEQLSIQFIQDDTYSAHYILNANRWFSQEERDFKTANAIPSHTMNLNGKTYHKKDVPTIYLSTL